MDAHIIYPNVVTCLGSAEELWNRLVKGESGFSSAKDIYPDWFPDKECLIGAIKELSPTGSRFLQILQILGDLFPNEIEESEIILGASSLGDLEGEFAGDTYSCFMHYLKSVYPNLAKKFKGVVSSACSSGTDVLSLASILVHEKKHDIVGVLAVDCLDPGKLLQHFALGTQANLKAMPFDENRSGTSFGEGGGFAIVANKEGIKKLGAKEAFKVLGFGLSCDAMHITAPDETGENPSLAIRRALAAAQCLPSDIGYINAHGSGTPLNDQVESIAFRKVFGTALDNALVSGSKGAIGHLLGSTGLVEVVLSCWALSNSVAPGTAGLTLKDETLNIPVIEEGKTETIMNPIALSTTFGFGGVNSALVVEKTI